MNEIIGAILTGIPNACITLAIVCVVLLYGIVGAWLVTAEYKTITFLYFVLSALIGFICLSYMFGVGV
jgi:succinate dehydrogenase hydrophobic anchor subunit